jgi:hypothetical protein
MRTADTGVIRPPAQPGVAMELRDARFREKLREVAELLTEKILPHGGLVVSVVTFAHAAGL